jgi:hypothetical protein
LGGWSALAAKNWPLINGHPEVIHFICRAERPETSVWAFSCGPTGDESVVVSSPASASRPCHRQICPCPSVSHNSGAEEPAGELFRTDVPKSRENAVIAEVRTSLNISDFRQMTSKIKVGK